MTFFYNRNIRSFQSNFFKGKGHFNCNTTNRKTGEIGNKVWLDANGNGIRDHGEEGVGGIKVTLTGAGKDGIFGTSDDITKVRTTNHNGHYKFKNLAAGDYKVTFDLPSDSESNFKFTTANVGDQEWKDSDVIDPSTGMTEVITLKAGQKHKVGAGLVQVTPSQSEPVSILEDGTYMLSNHPDGTDFGNGNPHGLILTGLFIDGMYQTGDISVFDFEHPDANMRMNINGDEIRIFGTAFGHLDVDGNFDYDDTPGLWQIDFTYNNADNVSGDDDISIDAQFAGLNTGTIKQLYGDQVEFDLTDEAGSNSFSFQVGDKTDNQGHRGVDGISGWGWLNHSNADEYVYHSDWLFTVDPEELINEGPSFTNLPQNGMLSIMENAPNVIDISSTDDFDGEGRGLQYSIVGGPDQDLFNIDQDTGAVSYTHLTLPTIYSV